MQLLFSLLSIFLAGEVNLIQSVDLGGTRRALVVRVYASYMLSGSELASELSLKKHAHLYKCRASQNNFLCYTHRFSLTRLVTLLKGNEK